MSIAPLLLRARDPGQGHNLAFGIVAITLAAIIFYIDTYTDIEGAIAVLYVVSMLLAAQSMTRIGLLIIAAGCAALTLLSYAMTHGEEADFQETLRLFGALAALSVTTLLLLKTETARLNLLSTHSALSESEARYRSIFDRTRVALWERDFSKLRSYLMDVRAQGVVDIKAYARVNPTLIDHCGSLIKAVAANQAAGELLGAKSSGTGIPQRALITGQEKFLDMLQAIMDGDGTFEDKVEVQTDEGENKLVLLSISLPEDPAAFGRVVVSMVDITQRELALRARAEAQAELTKASKAAIAGAMSASLAHELNQPLGAIVINAQTLLRWLDREPPDLPAVRRSAERMIRDGQRASELIHNARRVLSSSNNDLESIDLSSLIDETLALMEHELQQSKTAVLVDCSPHIPAVVTVKIELQQVLINLITNAIQAMDEAGCHERSVKITVARPDTEHVCIIVRDTGPGIGDDVKSKLFAPFFTTKATGMGMGLSICRSTLEARGGSLDGANHPEGGAVFEMRLPMRPETEHA
ncbi:MULTISPECIES: ATP-binding protein [unclassified Rhizobium]|uniref:PAS domain-containing sensor histidine kinase n=1 Tax=Rhizobium TaxID=379 RepID=UPI00084C7CC2|nr:MULTISPECIES: ATP-binding protein [unclassified Rhizobium]OEC96097.1 two-component sensor histidine kinase [Rhizobium sp. YK2]QYA16308.1 GHKL domain-containing protein [Rhizobium sp. AB2/73]UEQ84851.1 GHKL domain-containing protein [Rhizobium sp. AB2/73]